jgi:hypothetical protein
VRGRESLRNLPGDHERLVDRDRTLPDAVCQRRPIDQFHHQRMNAGRRVFEPVNLSDVRDD